MTAIDLFIIILLAVIVQLAVVAIGVFLKHWEGHQALLKRLAVFEGGAPAAAALSAGSARDAISAPPAWDGFRAFRVSRKAFLDRGREICSLDLVPDDGAAPPPFLPGRFLTLKLMAGDAAKPLIRCYSLADRPGLAHYRILVRRANPPAATPALPPGRASAYLLDRVCEGDIVDIRAPAGHFTLPTGDAPVVMIAGGIGITPFLSMLSAEFERKSGREIWLFHGIPDIEIHAAKTQLEAWANDHPSFHLIVRYSRQRESEVTASNGRIDIDLLRLTLPLKPFQYFVCGPKAMMEDIIPALEDWGVPHEAIHYEAFGPVVLNRRADAKTAKDGAPVNVTFAKTQKTAEWTGEDLSLLDFAERHGVEMVSGCRAGGCGSCQTAIDAGEAAYLLDPDFDPEPGHCLPCIAYPKSNLTLRI